MQARGSVHVGSFGSGFERHEHERRDTVIDGEFETVEPEPDPRNESDRDEPDGDSPRIGRR